MKFKRVICFKALFIVVVLIAIAILVRTFVKEDLKSTLKPSINTKTTLKFNYIWVDNSDSDRSVKNIINKFNQSQDQFSVEGNSGVSVEKQLIMIMSGNAPDIGLNYWPNAIRWTQNGLLECLDPYVKRDNYDIMDFLPATIERTSYQGKNYALPFEINTMALYYNIDMLKAAGFSHPPRTMGELQAMAKKLTETDENGKITTMGFIPDYPWIDNVLWPILFGAEFYDVKKNEVTTVSEEYISAIEFQNWFYKEWGWDNISKFKLEFGTKEQGPFYRGKLAMIMGGEWVQGEVRKYAPYMKLGVCPFPYPDDRPNLKDTNMITTSVLYISNDSKQKEYAWEFLKTLASKESMIYYSGANSMLMARESVLQDAVIRDNPDLRILSEFALNKNIRGFPPLPIVDEYLDSLTEQTQMVFKNKKTPYQAMLEVKKKIDPLLKNAKEIYTF